MKLVSHPHGAMEDDGGDALRKAVDMVPALAPAPGQGTRKVPGTWLETLALHMKLTGAEWRVVALVLASQPLSARRIAQRLRLPYTHAKRAARELVRWNVLRVSPEGLRFQSDPEVWGQKAEPDTMPAARQRPSKKPGSVRGPVPDSPKEMVFTFDEAPEPF